MINESYKFCLNLFIAYWYASRIKYTHCLKEQYPSTMKKTLPKLLLLIGIFLFVAPKPVQAYLDPGTGSYVIQMLAAAFFGGLYFITTGWKNIKNFVFKFIPGKDKKKSEKYEDKKE